MTEAYKGASGARGMGDWNAMFMGSGDRKDYAHKGSPGGPGAQYKGDERNFAPTEAKGVVGERSRMTMPKAVYKSGQFDSK